MYLIRLCSRLAMFLLLLGPLGLSANSSCKDSFKNYALEHFKKDLQVYVNHKVLNTNTNEKPKELVFTHLDQPNDVLIHLVKAFVETELAVVKYLDSRSMEYEVLEFHGRLVFHVKNFRSN